MARRGLLVVLAFVVLLAAPARAGFDEGVAAYKRGDHAAALRELRPLAAQGDARAQSILGLMYGKGQGVAQDHAEAVKWFRLAAEQGNADAQFSLGAMYTEGRGVTQDYAEAVKWYRKAAEQGDADAQFGLGVMYTEDRGVPQDYVRAHMWFNLAATKGDKDVVKNRDIVARNMSPAEIARAQELARDFKPRR
jgi:hypothetical protein